MLVRTAVLTCGARLVHPLQRVMGKVDRRALGRDAWCRACFGRRCCCSPEAANYSAGWTLEFVRIAIVKIAPALRMSAHCGVIIGLSGVGVMTTACLLLGGLPPFRLLVMAFCVASSSYAIDRIVDRGRDADHVIRTRHLPNTRALATVSAALFGGAVALGLSSERPVTGVLTLVFPVSVTLYVVPWMHRLNGRFQRAGLRRIKDIPFAKPFYVPGCWALMVVWAAPFFPGAAGSQVALAMLFLYPSLFITAAACDIRDEHADRAAGIRTFPVVLGRSRAIFMLQTVQVASMSLAVAVSALGLVPAVVGLLAPSGLAVWWCLGRLAAPDADVVFFADVVFDLLWILQPLPALAATALASSWP